MDTVTDVGETDAAPDAVLAAAGLALGEAILGAIELWAENQAVSLGGAALADDGRAVGAEIGVRIAPELLELLVADVDSQRGTPLTILRAAHGPLTELLRVHRVVELRRDPADVAAQPDDVFAIAPRSFSDLGPDVHDAGIRWGVAKAFAHRARHQRRPDESDGA